MPPHTRLTPCGRLVQPGVSSKQTPVVSDGSRMSIDGSVFCFTMECVSLFAGPVPLSFFAKTGADFFALVPASAGCNGILSSFGVADPPPHGNLTPFPRKTGVVGRTFRIRFSTVRFIFFYDAGFFSLTIRAPPSDLMDGLLFLAALDFTYYPLGV